MSEMTYFYVKIHSFIENKKIVLNVYVLKISKNSKYFEEPNNCKNYYNNINIIFICLAFLEIILKVKL